MAKPNFVSGFIIGSLISSTAALLFSPKSGRELRSTIRTKNEQASNSIKHLVNRSKENYHSVETSTKKNIQLVKEVSQELKSSINNWQESIQPHKNTIKSEIETIEQSVKQLENTLKSAQDSRS